MVCFEINTMEKIIKFYSVTVLILTSYTCIGQVYSEQKPMQVKGKVLTETGKPLTQVNVVSLANKTNGVHTNVKGEFSISLYKGHHILVFSHIGFQTLEKSIIVKKDNSLFVTIYLKEKLQLLPETVVTAKHNFGTVSSIAALKAEHKGIAGGTSVLVMKPRTQRLETIKDALRYEPGVVIQEFFGANDQPRLSIRGSGIQSNPQRRGLYLLQDGIPINHADGSFIIGIIDPAVSESVEVFKGANALKYGAATLGGAINFNSRTGRFSPGIQLKTEVGSFDYAQLTMLMGKQWGKKDVFLSITGSTRKGFRDHNQNQRLNLTANFGYRFSRRIDNRTYINYSNINFDIPGPLTLAMLKEDPSQINKGIDLPYYMGPYIERDKPGREAILMRISNKTSFKINTDLEVSIAAYCQYLQDRFVFPIVLSTQRSKGFDAGIYFRAQYKTPKAKLSLGILGSLGNLNRNGHINKNGLDSYMFSKDQLNAQNLTLYLGYNYFLNKKWHLIANLQTVYNERNSKDVFPEPELRPWYSHTSHQYRYFNSSNISLNQNFFAVNPRIGFIHHTGNTIQVFGNLSGSYEPPTYDELVGTRVTYNINTSPKDLFAIKLDKQSAITSELGSRYEGKRIGWNFSVYRSWIKDELLEVKDFVLGEKKTRNYPFTIHQGVEFGFRAVPFYDIFSTSKKDKIIVRGMYTYSDFYFDSGEYNGRKIAGIPPHYVTGSLEYNHTDFFMSMTIESQPTTSFIDNANTFSQPAYTIFGFRVGIKQWKKISCYVEGKNIFNKHYASSYVISDQVIVPPIPFPEFTVDNLALFNPGATRAFYFGITYSLLDNKRKSSQRLTKSDYKMD